MAHSAVWGHSPTHRQNTNSKKLTIENCHRAVSEGVQSLVNRIQTTSEKNTFVNFAFYIGFSGFNMDDVIS